MWFRKRKQDSGAVVQGLREQAFSLPAEDLGVVPAPGHLRVWAVLMETGYPEAVASLVTIADGTTSLYFSNGGGIIGAGEHARVRAAAEVFIASADANVNAFAPATAHPLPALGRVRFYARTFDSLLTSEAAEGDLGENRHPLPALSFGPCSCRRCPRVQSAPVIRYLDRAS